MNISYNDGTTVSKPCDAEEFAKALEDQRVVKAMVYRPGEIVTGNYVRVRA